MASRDRGGPALAGLAISDPPERWAALGFTVDDAGELSAGEVRITLGIAPPGRGIVGWTLTGLEGPDAVGALGAATDLAGLATRSASGPAAPSPAFEHRNRVTGVDHVVIATPDLDATQTELADRGIAFTRTRELRGRRMGFRRLGPSIMEVVEEPAAERARFWGVTFTVAHRADLDALSADGPLVSEPHDALQPGRRIAAVGRAAGLSTRVAFMD